MEMIEEMLADAPDLVVVWGLSIIYAVIILIVGLWVAKKISGLIVNSMNNKGVDPTIANFVGNIGYGLMVAFVIIAVLGQVGIQTTSLVAIMGAAGLAVGLALQGSLANFASGVLLIIFRPFKAGDFIDAGGASGTVEEVTLFSTKLVTPDNKAIVLPNSAVSSGAITNYSAKPQRRVDLLIGVAYDADLKQAKQAITEVIEADERVLKDMGITVAVSELADSSVNIVARSWVNTADYWPTYFDQTEGVKNKLDAVGISIPFPQMDVHLDK